MVKPSIKKDSEPNGSLLSEIQGIVSSGYRKFPAMSCLMIHIEDAAKAIQSLKQIQDQISFNDASCKAKDSRLNIAFTWRGLNKLNSEIANDQAELFKREFREGMVTPYRQRVLGDLDGCPSAPSSWFWGQPEKQEIHLALLVYELNEAQREARIRALLETPGIELVDRGRIDSVSLNNDKEHFGFRDGISQPWLRGLNKQGPRSDEVAWGEILLGHCDNSGAIERYPKIALNGSYLVVRQIEQDVQEFWKSFGDISSEQIRLASKQMGRWPDGTPLTLKPDGPENKPYNDFDYRHDQQGINCPAGSHIRRCNPRTGAKRDRGNKDRHRILRRGRVYGPPAPAEYFPDGLCADVSVENGSAKNGAAKSEARGLLFMCLNASFERQFEFMQQNWIHSSMISSLSDELDPIASQLDFELFTIPTNPIRKRCPRPTAHVKTVGGGYFFLPSRSAINKILECRSLS